MTIVRRPASIEAFLLDIDGTLYTDPAYGRFQNDVLIAELARLRGWSREATETALAEARATLTATDGTATDGTATDGTATSLGNAMAALGISIETSVEWRTRLIDPRRFLSPDRRLRETLETLARGEAGTSVRGAALVAVTNNPRAVGQAGLEALGIADLFRAVVGLDDTMRSKPATEPYRLAAHLAEAPFEACVSVGDRYDIDLAPALALGMGAVLVVGVEDVYALPTALGLAPAPHGS